MLCFLLLTSGRKQFLTDKDWKYLPICVFDYTTNYHHTKNKLLFFRRILENTETTKFNIRRVINFLSSNLCRFLELLNIDNYTLLCTKWFWFIIFFKYSWSTHWGNDFPKLQSSGGRPGQARQSANYCHKRQSFLCCRFKPKIWKSPDACIAGSHLQFPLVGYFGRDIQQRLSGQLQSVPHLIHSRPKNPIPILSHIPHFRF